MLIYEASQPPVQLHDAPATCHGYRMRAKMKRQNETDAVRLRNVTVQRLGSSDKNL